MNRWNRGAVLGAALILGVGLGPAAAQHGHAGHQHGQEASSALPKCPIMDEPVNFAMSVTTDEGPVYFCCEDCIKKYKANPVKYAGKAAAQRSALATRPKVQLTCPITRRPANPKVFTESDGRKVYFCSQGCISRYQEDPQKYQAALADSYTYQTKCPVMGEEINPQVFATAPNGMNVYFCCPGCEKRFFGDPAKYVPNLVAQGFAVRPEEMKAKAKQKDHSDHDHSGHDHGSHDH